MGKTETRIYLYFYIHKAATLGRFLFLYFLFILYFFIFYILYMLKKVHI